MAEESGTKTRVGPQALSLLERAVLQIKLGAKEIIFSKGHESAVSYLKMIKTLVQKEEISDGQYEGLFSGEKPFFVFQGILRKEFYIDWARGYRVRSVLFRKGRDPVSFPQIPCLPYIEDPLAEQMIASFCNTCDTEFSNF